MLSCPRRNAGIKIRNRTGRGDSRSKARQTRGFKAGIIGSKTHESGTGFSSLFRTIPFGRGVRRLPPPAAVRATAAQDTPEFSEWRLEDESRPKFACGLGSGGIPAHPRPTRVSSIPTIYNFADVEQWVAPPTRIPLELGSLSAFEARGFPLSPFHPSSRPFFLGRRRADSSRHSGLPAASRPASRR